jgi:hypothetical protein
MYQRLRDKWAQRKYRQGWDAAHLNAIRNGAAGDDVNRPDLLRKVSDERLNELLGGDIKGDGRVALEREQRRREAWAAPAGRAFWISLLAIFISAATLVFTIYNFAVTEARPNRTEPAPTSAPSAPRPVHTLDPASPRSPNPTQ